MCYWSDFANHHLHCYKPNVALQSGGDYILLSLTEEPGKTCRGLTDNWICDLFLTEFYFKPKEKQLLRNKNLLTVKATTTFF